ncbi:hypothetical protein [Saccharopolyspora griseoalba]|uniref:Uncharacterized protein n=1 Tax=Saccharopolyspora griseoalba TaxID=1431848 RepID=A0ABW2LR03_9PSEU
MSTDPVKAAQEIEAQRSRDRVKLIKDLRDAVEADSKISDVEAALQKAVSSLPSSVDGAVQNALKAVEELRKGTHEAVAQQRRAARQAGWENSQLVDLGLAKSKSKRRTASKPASQPSNTDTASGAADAQSLGEG